MSKKHDEHMIKQNRKEDRMGIKFPTQLFGASDEKVSIMLPGLMLSAVDRLGEVLGLPDRSKTIRWCLEQILKEAIEQGKIVLPGSDKVG